MAVLRKNRRKIKYKDIDYVWYVKADEDHCDKKILTIISQDKQLIITYPIGANPPYIVSKGKVFQGKKMDGVWHRYRLPFRGEEVIVPKFVVQLISFATEESIAEEIQFDGKKVWY